MLSIKGEPCGLCQGHSAQHHGPPRGKQAVFGCGAALGPKKVDFVVLEIRLLPVSSLWLFSLGHEYLLTAFHLQISGHWSLEEEFKSIYYVYSY